MSMITQPDASLTPPAVDRRYHVQQLRISPNAVQWTLLAAAALHVIAYLVFAFNYHHLDFRFFGSNFLYQAFDLNGEITIPTWYSSSLLLVAALILAAISAVALRYGYQYGWHWMGLAFLFLALSVDESADIHGAVSRKMSVSLELDGLLTYPWVIPGAIFVLVAGCLYARFLRDLPAATRRSYLLAGALFVSGALVVESLEAAYDSRFGDTGPYLLMVAIEEALEMAGVIVFISASLAHAGTLASVLQISLASRDGG